jgi:hypothetical protein
VEALLWKVTLILTVPSAMLRGRAEHPTRSTLKPSLLAIVRRGFPPWITWPRRDGPHAGSHLPAATCSCHHPACNGLLFGNRSAELELMTTHVQ